VFNIDSVLHVHLNVMIFPCNNFQYDFSSLVYLVDAAAAVDNSARISPENNLDFYAYSQAAPYNVIAARLHSILPSILLYILSIEYQ
jgi:hypothetical protein